MRLKCIKLTGFKSFVDLTTVTFPGNMTAVVGPNGCGKSNIIDAVRWVMGESSAKNLRGDSMTDVIFKGSKSRKASGYAQVELIFDNSEGRVTGEYASFTEISVKRRLSSDTQNLYFLNGGRCRRKDIMDIFLGTGLGPRSYSIISQGMISNLIESKPEELRYFIEEAAGISKYKERRRETENRIRRTTENLARLTDLREELDKRLSHLKKQAESAEKYKTFKAEERQKKAELNAIKWRDLDIMLQKQGIEIGHLEVEIESLVTKQVTADSLAEKLRLEQQESDETFRQSQTKYYATGNEITRIEQTITHKKEKYTQLSQDLEENKVLHTEYQGHLEADKVLVTNIEQDLEKINPALEKLKEETFVQTKNYEKIENNLRDWKEKWEHFNAQYEDSRRKAEVTQSTIQHMEQALLRTEEQIRRTEEEIQRLQNDNHERGSLDEVRLDLIEREETTLSSQKDLDLTSQSIQTIRKQLELLLKKRAENQQNLSKALGTKSSLEALQQETLLKSEQTSKWLNTHQLEAQKKLMEIIRVSEEWDTAVETVLGDFIQSVTVDRLEQVTRNLKKIGKNVNLAIVSLSQKHDFAEKNRDEVIRFPSAMPLAKYVSGIEDLSLLEGIWAVESLQDALKIQSHLEPYESVITKNGVWLGAGWLRISSDTEIEKGVLSRQQALDDINKSIKIFTEKSDKIQLEISESQSCLENEERKLKTINMNLSEQNRQIGDLKASISAQEVRLDEEQLQLQRLIETLSASQEQRTEEQEILSENRLNLQEELDNMEKNNKDRELYLSQQNSLENELSKFRENDKEHHSKTHDLALQKQSLETRKAEKINAVERLQVQIQHIEKKMETIKASLASSEEDVDEDLDEQLNQLLEKQSLQEVSMQEAKDKLETVNQKLREYENAKSDSEKMVQNIRSNLESERMKAQELRIRAKTHEEQLVESHFDLKTLLKNLDEHTTETLWVTEINKIENQIERLGAINLAAIEEFEQQSERLTYLNAQNDDLEEALATLQKAIEKIDSETRKRFDMTFNKINQGLQELFPKVFGGGLAYLEQTGDDLLNTGVAIMAQPPGKKNSTIHLLSGGEKALTAIALVFAIFRLNPSPFCLLDEVDAPLDDANVRRYASMVNEMSTQVQFIYITHNKIAMELAGQLIGITMHEPGVSRPVSVDIDAAAEMALA